MLCMLRSRLLRACGCSGRAGGWLPGSPVVRTCTRVVGGSRRRVGWGLAKVHALGSSKFFGLGIRRLWWGRGAPTALPAVALLPGAGFQPQGDHAPGQHMPQAVLPKAAQRRQGCQRHEALARPDPPQSLPCHPRARMQAQTLPMILTPPHRNLIAQAHNGSGKTTCFVLAMLSRVDTKLKAPQVGCVDRGEGGGWGRKFAMIASRGASWVSRAGPVAVEPPLRQEVCSVGLFASLALTPLTCKGPVHAYYMSSSTRKNNGGASHTCACLTLCSARFCFRRCASCVYVV
jgi:hypothetical protein